MDNIRAATVQALDFAKSVTNADGSTNSKLVNTHLMLLFILYMKMSCDLFLFIKDGRKMALLRRAIKAQTDFTIATISGHGIDCHLVGLREVAFVY